MVKQLHQFKTIKTVGPFPMNPARSPVEVSEVNVLLRVAKVMDLTAEDGDDAEEICEKDDFVTFPNVQDLQDFWWMPKSTESLRKHRLDRQKHLSQGVCDGYSSTTIWDSWYADPWQILYLVDIWRFFSWLKGEQWIMKHLSKCLCPKAASKKQCQRGSLQKQCPAPKKQVVLARRIRQRRKKSRCPLTPHFRGRRPSRQAQFVSACSFFEEGCKPKKLEVVKTL